MGVLKAKVGGVWVPVSQGISLAQVGYVGSAILAADQTIPTGSVITDITGVSVTWTADPTRRYRTSLYIGAADVPSGAATQMTVYITDSANALKRNAGATVQPSSRMSFALEVVETGLSGTQTRKARFASTANSTVIAATGAQSYAPVLVVEDITTVTPTTPTGPRAFASNAERDTLWPAASAGIGAMCSTVDKSRLWLSDGTTWKLTGGSMPRCKAQKLSVQSVGGSAAITWPETEMYDTDSIHDTVTNNSRMTIPAGLGGLWLFSAFLYLPPAAAGSELYLMKNGAAERFAWLKLASTASEDLAIDISAMIPCNAGDYVEVQGSSSVTRSYGHISLPGYFTASYMGAL
jgi:hypothetical protein